MVAIATGATTITAMSLVTATAALAAPSAVSVGCGGDSFSTISEGVDAVADGGTVSVCAGNYSEDVVVTKPVTLQGPRTAVVDPGTANNSPLFDILGNNAFTVLSPYVTINGFTVQHATGDGVFLAGDHGVVQNVSSVNNGNDGINVDGSSYSKIQRNTVSGNNGGIELANDPDAAGITLPGVTGTASYDSVVDNVVDGNPFACGIFLVDHAGGGPSTGIHDNVVQRNQVTNNALDGYGAGILLASAMENGAVYNNLLQGNTILGNGLSGVSVHSHVPGQTFGGNVVTGNDIGTNNVRGFDAPDHQTTGVFIGSNDPLGITVSHNTIHDNHFGVYTAGPVTAHALKSNRYTQVDVPLFANETYGF